MNIKLFYFDAYGGRMETKDLETLIKLLETSNLESLSYKDKDFELELKKPSSLNQNSSPHQTISATPTHDGVLNQETKGTIIKSPLVGVFYARPSKDDVPFVSLNQSVNEGDTLCILEAMKVMNEIKANTSGKVVEILVKDGETVDYDQPLFKIV